MIKQGPTKTFLGKFTCKFILSYRFYEILPQLFKIKPYFSAEFWVFCTKILPLPTPDLTGELFGSGNRWMSRAASLHVSPLECV